MIKTYRKSCLEPWFTYIASCQKVIEGRLYRGDWMIMEIGDTLILYNEEGKEITTRVVGIHQRQTFQQLFEDYSKYLLPTGNASIYQQWFTPRDEEIYGVVGIQVEIIL